MRFLDKFKIKKKATNASLPTTTHQGAQAEQIALDYLRQQGLRLIDRNYRTPGRGGGEIDLIMQTLDATLVFVEVRMRKNSQFGGAAESITPAKQARIILAAQHFLLRHAQYAHAACRFDAVLILREPQADQPSLQWLQAAFD